MYVCVCPKIFHNLSGPSEWHAPKFAQLILFLWLVQHQLQGLKFGWKSQPLWLDGFAYLCPATAFELYECISACSCRSSSDMLWCICPHDKACGRTIFSQATAKVHDHMLLIRPLFGGVLINFFRIHQVILHTKQQHKSAPEKQVMNLQLRLTSNYNVCRFLLSPWHLSSHPPGPTNFVVSTWQIHPRKLSAWPCKPCQWP